MKLIALYKVFRGGEWFEASLESIRENTDGAVVVFSNTSWHKSNRVENCSEPLRQFVLKHPEYSVTVVQDNFKNEHEQYVAGLATIEMLYGDARVLIIDSDEIWVPHDVAVLRNRINMFPQFDYYKTGIYTYLKSPFWRVYPREPYHATVALCSAKMLKFAGRFVDSHPQLYFDDLSFHHFSYVRKDEAEIRAKWLDTDSQEIYKGNIKWLDTIWKKLPRGRNLHYCNGASQCWKMIEVIDYSSLPPNVRDAVLTYERTT